MANYLTLEEAAQQLGISTEQLVEIRSQGKVRGFRDGTSWKFPEDAINRLKDELGDVLEGGSGILVGDSGGSSGKVIGGEDASGESGSDVDVGADPVASGGSDSDVNLVASASHESDVAIVPTDSDFEFDSDERSGDLVEIDSAELQLDNPALAGDSSQLELAIEPNKGSTGPIKDEELKEIAAAKPGSVAEEKGGVPASSGSSVLDLGGDIDDLQLKGDSELNAGSSFDSSEDVIASDDSDLDLLGSDVSGVDSQLSSPGASSLELLGSLDEAPDVKLSDATGSRGENVLSELDLLGDEQQQKSGLIHGDSEDLLGSSGLGDPGGDDALADDDDLVIADDDDDLMLNSVGSDISVAGDSGINLMSPSDSGLSLESEPLDLAGSSISALDLGAELSGEGSSGGMGSGGDGSAVDFQADEEFQLSPSGLGLEADVESGSQVIEVEDSEAIGEAVQFDDAAFADDSVGAFGDEGGAAVSDALSMGDDDGDAVSIDQSSSSAAPAAAAAMGAYEVPFSLLQCITLVMIISVMTLGGMLMTDLVRNMWTYAEPSAPVSSLTDSLISLMGF